MTMEGRHSGVNRASDGRGVQRSRSVSLFFLIVTLSQVFPVLEPAFSPVNRDDNPWLASLRGCCEGHTSLRVLETLRGGTINTLA